MLMQRSASGRFENAVQMKGHTEAVNYVCYFVFIKSTDLIDKDALEKRETEYKAKITFVIHRAKLLERYKLLSIERRQQELLIQGYRLFNYTSSTYDQTKKRPILCLICIIIII